MDDLIKRDYLIKKFEDTGQPAISEMGKGYDLGIKAALRVVKKAPTVNRWIPCSERLPEDNAEVLVSFCRRYIKIGYIEPGDGLRYWVIPGHSVVPLNYIEAWMPMPDAYEPPKE